MINSSILCGRTSWKLLRSAARVPHATTTSCASIHGAGAGNTEQDNATLLGAISNVHAARTRILNLCGNCYSGLSSSRTVVSANFPALSGHGVGISSVRFMCTAPQEDKDMVIRLRGLPYSASVDDVVTFLEGCDIVGGKGGIYLTNRGEAYIEMKSENDVRSAKLKHMKYIGSRYIEVNQSTKKEMESWKEEGLVIKLRGLPWSASEEDVASFLEGCNIADGKKGIHFTHFKNGKRNGNAYVELTSEEDVMKAQSKHKELMGRRYIEVFRASTIEMDRVNSRFQGPPVGEN